MATNHPFKHLFEYELEILDASSLDELIDIYERLLLEEDESNLTNPKEEAI